MKSEKNLLIVVLILQLVVIAGQWLEGPRILPSAQAQVANPGADRQAMLDEQKSTNSKLDRLISILEGGNLQVKVVQPDEAKGKAPGR